MAEDKNQQQQGNARPADRRGMTRGQIRAIRRERSQAKKRRKRILYTLAGGIVAALFIGALLFPEGAQNLVQPPYLNTDGPVPTQPDEGVTHVQPGTPGGPYRTTPAVSGNHWFTPPIDAVPTGAPANWGVYNQPLPDEVLIHNLEHGGIGLHYNCSPTEEACAELIENLRSMIPVGASQFIMSPYPDMDSRIAITAWRHLDKMEEFDRERIQEFINAYRNRAPESVPGNMW